ncbi:MAG: OsmC family protein [Dongiaceae bacterium]
MLNGVDRQALGDVTEAVKVRPELAKFEFRLENRWEDGARNRSLVDGFAGVGTEQAHPAPFALSNDEPLVLLGTDSAPNPVEYLLHALAGCLTTSLVYHAAARGIAVRGVKTRFEGDLDLRGFLGLSHEVRKGFREIRAVFEIEGDLTQAQKRELMKIGQGFSPVFDMVSRGVPVSCRLAEENVRAMPSAA